MGDLSPRFVVESFDEAKKCGWLSVDQPSGRNEDYCTCGIFDTSVDPPMLVGSDGGEPEDQTLDRDWDWVVEELNKVNDGWKNAMDDLRNQCDDLHNQRDVAMVRAVNPIE